MVTIAMKTCQSSHISSMLENVRAYPVAQEGGVSSGGARLWKELSTYQVYA
jgi:hypothetical protein